MIKAFFVTDLHGKIGRYERLFAEMLNDPPQVLFLGGDLLPHRLRPVQWGDEMIENFVEDYLSKRFLKLKEKMRNNYPEVFLIMGNDDARSEEQYFIDGAHHGHWQYIHQKSIPYKDFIVSGYAYIPPSPFQIKDWEKYDVSRYVDPGCISPNEGFRTVDPPEDIEHGTIAKDLELLVKEKDTSRTVFLFHSPPYRTLLDRAALDGVMFEHVPLDVHVGSIAIKRFIEKYQPLVTMHGHIHESSRLTGQWRERIGQTFAFNAAIDTPHLSLIKFDFNDPSSSERIVLDI
ncbi:MAG: metallophosphoesterase [Bacteroidetes bacterium]|nr:metallophosphoesterase [Bacteroidota bacterium]